jgi:hypothetical protein
MKNHENRALSSSLQVRRVAQLALLAIACSTTPPDPEGTGGAAGRAGSGGSTPTAGRGGSNAVGGASGSANTGGKSVGGSSATGGGGLGTGGAPTAGASTGGASTGGSAGAATGGSSSGSGGLATGGGAGSGGTAGGANGGSSPGGAGSGGTAGGAGGGGGSPGVVRSPGCDKNPTMTFEQVPGESGQNVGFGDGGYVRIGDRGFAMRLPDDYDNSRPYPLFFGFHWNGGNSKEVDTGGSNRYEMAHFGLQKLSGNGAFFVAPDGLGGGWANSGGRDLQFVDAMVELITENYCVDMSRLFANGFSYGGGMSYAIACARANVFRGVAIYNGAVLSGCEGGNSPIAYWQMAGQTDNVCTIGAGRAMRDRFVENNGCTEQNPPEPPQPPPYLRNGGHICTTYSGCSSGHPLRWCAHQSGHGNAIVDGTADLYNTCATAPQTCSDSCPCSWVPQDVWSFFTSL